MRENAAGGRAEGAPHGAARVSRPRKLVVAGAALLASTPFLAMLPLAGAGAAVPSAPHAVRVAPTVEVAHAPSIPVADHALGAVAASTVETGAVVLKPRDESAITSFISSVTDIKSPMYHHYLAPGAYEARFGPTAASIAAVSSQLRADGLTVDSVSSDGLLVSFSGTASRIESAFGTGLESYRLPDGSKGLATTGAIRVPSTIAASVSSVIGLDSLVEAQPADIRPGARPGAHLVKAEAPKFTHPAGAPTPCAAATQDALTSGGLTDDAIANAYGATPLYALSDFGQGEHIAVYELQPFLNSDIETFDTCYFGAAEATVMSGLLKMTPVDGGELQPGPGSENDESTLDIEDVSALAPGANIDVYEAPNTTFGGLDEYTTIVDSDTDQVVTSSWAVCEQLAQLVEPGLQGAENFLFEQAAAQGQTVLSAAGDTGDDSCNEARAVPEPSGQNVLSLLDPASQPFVVSVGGTTIDDATQPPSEHVWDDGAQWGAGGGGISESWTMPAWQRQLALSTANTDDVENAESVETAYAQYSAPFDTPTFCDGTLGLAANTPCRETPDVVAQADEFTGSITIYGQSLGYGNPNGWATIGGTSSATPIWAAMLTLVNASSSCSSDKVNGVQDVGFASPILYGIADNAAAYAASFNDITSGNNDVYGLDNGLVFPARTGYDMASGLGSPQLTTPSGGDALAYYMCQYGAALLPPSVTALSPKFGSTAGGEVVTVTGLGFGTTGTPKVKSVQVGGGQVTSFAVVNNTSMTIVLPAASLTVPSGSPDPTEDGAGPAQIIVTSTTGQSSMPTATTLFEYVDESAGASVPSVTSLSPYGGDDSTPPSVTIFGSGFTSPAASDTVEFGGAGAISVTYVSPYELVVTPPAYGALTPSKACKVDDGASGQPLNPAQDVCQVSVTVAVGGKTSATATILPPYEGPLSFDNMGGEVLPSGCGCEDEPQTSEFDYVPTPTITSVSTGTPADLPGNAADLASEYGGAATNTVTVTGTGMDPLTSSYLTLSFGGGFNEGSIDYPVEESGTSFVFEAPAVLSPISPPSTEPEFITVGFTSIAGASTTGSVWYAGAPLVTSVVATATGAPAVPDSVSCTSPPPGAGCGTPVTLSGVGFYQAVGPIAYEDLVSGFSLGLQNTYTEQSDTVITTQSVQENPAEVAAVVCSNTACAVGPDDYLLVYPPGNPKITSVVPAAGPAHGGNTIAVNGSNLGCTASVHFGKVAAIQESNAQALLDCGQTNQVLVTVPPGPVGTVTISLETVESIVTGVAPATATYTYDLSTPSAPQALQVIPGGGEATLRWNAPASDGGDAVNHYYIAASSPGRPTQAVRVPAGTTSYTFSHLQPGVGWTFVMAAVSAAGTGLPATSPVTLLGPGDNGYLVATANGAVFGFGSLSSSGGSGGGKISGTVVGIATTPDALGYFEVTSTGSVYNFGDAGWYGQPGSLGSGHIVGIAATADGHGYWLVSNLGTVWAYGDATGFGSASGVSDVVGIAPDLSGGGYYLAEANGTVLAKGNAVFRGDMSGKSLNAPIVGITLDPATGGYWLVASDGGVFAFDARFFGSMQGRHLNQGAVDLASTPDGGGYWIEAADNGLFTFGSARYVGNAQSQAESAGVGVAAG
jgi:hypothetical protein